MSFLYPLGFLGLIAIPILIIIYIIKNKYTEQVISATYIWNLSEKFLKRKNPINRLTGIISLILQILAVILISFAIAHPVFVLRNAAFDYCFILDGSGSMNIAVGRDTRLDEGKDKVLSLINGAADGSSFSFIYAGYTTDVIFENIEDKRQAANLISDINSAYVSTGFSDALGVAQKYFDENPSVKTYLITDKSYESSENIEVIDVSAHETNYALSNVKSSFTGGTLEVSGEAFSYENDASVTVNFYVDGIAKGSKTLGLSMLEACPFKFEAEVDDFKTLSVSIADKDALSLDNEVIIYNEKSDESFRTLLVSKTLYVKAVLTTLGYRQIDVVSAEDYDKESRSGYGLYVFDGFTPEVLPKDGAVWFFNPVSDVENSGFSIQGDPVNKVGKLVYFDYDSPKVQTLLKDIPKNAEIYITGYSKCVWYRSFTELYSFDNNHMIFAGTNSYGNREVVFAFDLEHSDIILSPVFVPLVKNLLNYTFPDVAENRLLYCGDTAQINVLANCNSIRVDTPLGNIEYLETGNDTVEYQLREVGVYTITLMMGDMPRVAHIYSQLPEAERATTVKEQTAVSLEGTAGDEKRDGKYDDLIIMFILLAVVVIADWAVYCYEQYQL